MDPLYYYFQFVDLLAGLPLSATLFGLKIFSVVVSIAALYWYLSTLFKINTLGPAEEIITAPDKAAAIQEIVAKPWIEVQEKMASPNPADWVLAIIQADAILDKILKASGYIGDTMGDRLRQINRAELEAIDDVWRSHKIRNRLAHGTGEALTRSEAEGAIQGYEKAFRELNYI
ncbi:MAG: hypothetical protein UY71_C0020G0010 [Parcubacteria group bacterium GW2011_GWB1_52_7]|nr:MAG: hypothetical protein UY64_C0022G0011 [Parcubacteria group bacterium GW2011_GWA1_51_12]KKW28510.1 MAG: hypothetical protein UY71_C0020G0010 [Parcubacteria group bacterium GW2011_GWB1_52_7]